MKKTLLLFIFGSALTACVTVPMGDAKQDAALKTFIAPSNKAGIFIYRDETIGAGVKMTVSIDGDVVGQNAPLTYLYREVTPGAHTVSSGQAASHTVIVNVKAGTLVYVWQRVRYLSSLEVVDEEKGKKGVLATKLAASN